MTPPLSRFLLQVTLILLLVEMSVTAFAGLPPLVIVAHDQRISNDTLRTVEKRMSSMYPEIPLYKFPNNIVFRNVSEETLTQFRHSLKVAKDLFYDGEFDASLKALTLLHDQLGGHMPSTTFSHTLRELDRDTLLYAAMAERELNTGGIYTEHLNTAAARYGSITFNSGEFPPWLRAEYQFAIEKHAPREYRVQVPTDSGCQTEIDGKAAPETDNNGRVPIPAGMHTFQLRCQSGHRSFMSWLEVEAQLTEWHPVDVEGYHIRTTDHSIVLTPETTFQTEPGQLETTLREIMPVLNTDKLLLLQLDTPENTIGLLDVHRGVQSRISAGSGVLNDRQIGFILDKLLNRSDSTQPSDATGITSPVRRRSWIKRPIPWILISSGVALLTTGLILGQKYGRPSPQVPWVTAMQISGAALTGLGIGFFFVPDWEISRSGHALGIHGAVSF